MLIFVISSSISISIIRDIYIVHEGSQVYIVYLGYFLFCLAIFSTKFTKLFILPG